MRQKVDVPVYTCARVDTDFGWVGLIGSQGGLVSLVFPQPSPEAVLEGLPMQLSGRIEVDDGAFADVAEELRSYFASKPVQFTARVDETLGTPFQRKVWEAVRAIPYGKTMSYGEVASQIGKPGAARAVGAAVGANPVPIVIPCHRVLAADGKLGGFGGGLELKRRLLRLEGVGIG